MCHAAPGHFGRARQRGGGPVLNVTRICILLGRGTVVGAGTSAPRPEPPRPPCTRLCCRPGGSSRGGRHLPCTPPWVSVHVPLCVCELGCVCVVCVSVSVCLHVPATVCCECARGKRQVSNREPRGIQPQVPQTFRLPAGPFADPDLPGNSDPPVPTGHRPSL